MATRLAVATANASAAAAVLRPDAGPAAGRLRIYSGTQPATSDTAASGTLLAELTLSDPAFGAPSNGVCTAAAITGDTSADATGTAGWFRVVDSTGAACWDGSVTATGGGGDLTLSSTSIIQGGTVNVTALNYTQPLT